MLSPRLAMAVIACPHCGTRYQVPAETLGSGGREVQCAHCTRSWLAMPGTEAAPEPEPAPAADADRMFDGPTERDLDAAFAAAERLVAAAAAASAAEQEPRPAEDAPPPGPAPPPPGERTGARNGARRRKPLPATLPGARPRRLARLASIGLLALLAGGGIGCRTEIVRYLPDMAGAYAALGMPVNTVGLEFRDVSTVLALRSGANVMQVQARIYSVAPRLVAVPPVVVTLLDAHGVPLYEWSVTPQTRDLEPGEVVDFASQLTGPPAGATRVRLTFAGGPGSSATPIAPAIQQPAI